MPYGFIVFQPENYTSFNEWPRYTTRHLRISPIRLRRMERQEETHVKSETRSRCPPVAFGYGGTEQSAHGVGAGRGDTATGCGAVSSGGRCSGANGIGGGPAHSGAGGRYSGAHLH